MRLLPSAVAAGDSAVAYALDDTGTPCNASAEGGCGTGPCQEDDEAAVVGEGAQGGVVCSGGHPAAADELMSEEEQPHDADVEGEDYGAEDADVHSAVDCEAEDPALAALSSAGLGYSDEEEPIELHTSWQGQHMRRSGQHGGKTARTVALPPGRTFTPSTAGASDRHPATGGLRRTGQLTAVMGGMRVTPKLGGPARGASRRRPGAATEPSGTSSRSAQGGEPLVKKQRVSHPLQAKPAAVQRTSQQPARKKADATKTNVGHVVRGKADATRSRLKDHSYFY